MHSSHYSDNIRFRPCWLKGEKHRKEKAVFEREGKTTFAFQSWSFDMGRGVREKVVNQYRRVTKTPLQVSHLLLVDIRCVFPIERKENWGVTQTLLPKNDNKCD